MAKKFNFGLIIPLYFFLIALRVSHMPLDRVWDLIWAFFSIFFTKASIGEELVQQLHPVSPISAEETCKSFRGATGLCVASFTSDFLIKHAGCTSDDLSELL